MGGVGQCRKMTAHCFLSHGDVSGVVVPVKAKVFELALKFVGDGKDEGINEGRVRLVGAEEGASFGEEEVVDFAPDEGSDGGCVGHCVMRRLKLLC